MPAAFGTTFIPQSEHVCTSIDLMSNNEKNADTEPEVIV